MINVFSSLAGVIMVQMVRLAAFSALLALALQAPAQILVTHGVPASALSPTPDGRVHGVPASALSPAPLPPGVNPPLRPFFSHRPPRPFRRDHRHDHDVVVVPIYYGGYGPGYDYGYPSVADPQVDPSADAQPAGQDSEAQVATSEEALRLAYLQGARDALAQEKAKESAQEKPSPAKRDPFAPTSTAKSDPEPKTEADSSPATVFIFKDGHKIETRNFAIMGKTLYDMSGTTLRKVQLTDLDTEATVKANDDNGITVKLP